MKKDKNIKITQLVVKRKIENFTPINAFNSITNNKDSIKAFLFENNEKNKQDYSFLGVNPVETLRIKDGLAYLEKKDETIILNGSPEKIINDYLLKYEVEKKPDLPPFTGGIIGYISYDFVKYLEKINLPLINSFGENEACLMLFKDVIIFDHSGNDLYIIANILKENPSEKDKEKALNEAKILEKQIIKFPEITQPDITEIYNDLSVKTTFGEEKFYNAVKKIKDHIKNGDIFQCVLSERFSFSLEAPPFTVYQVLRKINPSPYLFYISTGNETILGSSPEMLVRVSKGKVSLCPIAGTRPRGRDDTEDKKYEKALLRSTKEKAEHLMLVDLGRNDIGRVSQTGTVQVKQFMQVERFSSVMHLVSLLEGSLKEDKTPFDAFKAAFPAGTLSGAPKVRAMEIISEFEPVRRGAYGGSIFCYGFTGYLDSCITIRSLFVKNNQGYIQAGAGIVADSNPKNEYQEILNKSKAVIRAVNLAHKFANQEVLK